MITTIPAKEFDAYIARNTSNNLAQISEYWEPILTQLKAIQKEGDPAILEYNENLRPIYAKNNHFLVSKEDREQAWQKLDPALKSTLEMIKKNCETFCRHQLIQSFIYPLGDSYVGMQTLPMDAVGIYISAQHHPSPSVLFKYAIPALVAGVKRITLTLPPESASPVMLAVSHLLELSELHVVDGVSALAALVYGTQSISKVQKIVGRGDERFRVAQKMLYDDVGMEGLSYKEDWVIFADETSNPTYIAADYIAAIDENPDNRVFLIAWNQSIVSNVEEALECQLQHQHRSDSFKEQLAKQSVFIHAENATQGISIINTLTPARVILYTKKPETYVSKIENAGIIYIGTFSIPFVSDMILGLNPCLPTEGASAFSAPLSPLDFVKKHYLAYIHKNEWEHHAQLAHNYASFEGLLGHTNAIQTRLDNPK